jgi:hypothetical protein
VLDNTSLFRDILQKILSGNDIGHGQNGYYLASSGTVAWRDLYTAMARALTKRGVVDGEAIKPADDTILAKMGEALGCPKGMVRLQLGGRYVDRTSFTLVITYCGLVVRFGRSMASTLAGKLVIHHSIF